MAANRIAILDDPVPLEPIVVASNTPCSNIFIRDMCVALASPELNPDCVEEGCTIEIVAAYIADLKSRSAETPSPTPATPLVPNDSEKGLSAQQLLGISLNGRSIVVEPPPGWIEENQLPPNGVVSADEFVSSFVLELAPNSSVAGVHSDLIAMDLVIREFDALISFSGIPAANGVIGPGNNITITH